VSGRLGGSLAFHISLVLVVVLEKRITALRTRKRRRKRKSRTFAEARPPSSFEICIAAPFVFFLAQSGHFDTLSPGWFRQRWKSWLWWQSATSVVVTHWH
jgi:hypothetical protein